MKIQNTLTRQINTITPLDGKTYRIYSCGPTVYDHAHIGNLASFIYADTLRRTLSKSDYNAKHVMNYTDVDDKTIARSRERYPDTDPREALRKLAEKYIESFLEDIQAVGNDTEAVTFLRATDYIEEMKALVTELHAKGFAYVGDDGVYFSIDAYRKSGKVYGQLLELSAESTSEARIQNDEYDKDSIHDFALWKVKKDNEPAWEFTLDGKDLTGRPGWHLECSVMSRAGLGQPFDIHTGGVDLIFPHHENEIAQSTAASDNASMASVFFHSNHMLVEGKKMAKSAGNFHTLTDIIDKGYDPLAFRLLVLQSNYRNQIQFSWDNLQAAQSRLKHLRAAADLRYQLHTASDETDLLISRLEMAKKSISKALQDDLNTAEALYELSTLVEDIDKSGISTASLDTYTEFLDWIDDLLGLNLSDTQDITGEQKQLITERKAARKANDWTKSDQLRDTLAAQGIGIQDTPRGTIWHRL